MIQFHEAEIISHLWILPIKAKKTPTSLLFYPYSMWTEGLTSKTLHERQSLYIEAIPCLQKGVGLDDFLRSLPTLLFYGSMIFHGFEFSSIWHNKKHREC